MLAAMVDLARTLVRYRSLLWTLVMRELRARYRGSVLGFLWSLLNPLLLLAVYSFVFGMILGPRGLVEVRPYGVFLVTGLFPWIWVSTSLLEGCTSLTANGGLIRKAVFPVEVLPAVAVVANLMHFLLALPIVGVALVAGRLLGYPISGWTAVLLPAVLAIEVVMVAGLAFALSAVCVHFKDVRDLLGNLLVLAFFLAPVFLVTFLRDTFFRVALRAVALRVNRLRVAFFRVAFLDAAAPEAVRRTAVFFFRETFLRVAFLADRLTFFFITVLFTLREESVREITNKRNDVPLRNPQLQRNTAFEARSTDAYTQMNETWFDVGLLTLPSASLNSSTDDEALVWGRAR